MVSLGLGFPLMSKSKVQSLVSLVRRCIQILILLLFSEVVPRLIA